MILQLRVEFEQHVSTDFASLVGRVTVLEKKLAELTAKVGKGGSGGAPIVQNNYDDELKRLRERAAKRSAARVKVALAFFDPASLKSSPA